jgi:hypothetical protein
VLPVGGGEGVDCPALILIENARPHELAGCFLDLVRGFDVPMGTVVVISSASHLGRSGTAAYAGDIVAAMNRIREAYGRSVRVVHGFPLIGGGLVDESTIRGLREIEYWLAEVDRRRQCSLPETSDYFITHFLTSKTTHTTNGNQRLALKLPTSLHSSDSGIFVSPGWEDLPGSLPALGEEDERAFLHVMLSELNNKFALQLDTCPVTDRSSQLGTDTTDECRFGIVLAGSSHSVRLIDPLESTNLRVVDSTTPGFRVTEQSVADMAAELAEKVSDLDPNDNVVVIQLLDNSSYECKTPSGDRILPKRGRDGKYHAVGELGVIGKDTLRDHFMALQPVFRAVKGFKVLVLTPLPRYLWNRCCDDASHITNSERESFASDMGKSLKDLTINLRNMIFMRKLRGVSVLNTVEALGIVPNGNESDLGLDRIIAIWGSDPIHPTPVAYRILAEKIGEKAESLLREPAAPATPMGNVTQKRKADSREAWVGGSQSIAKRTEGGQHGKKVVRGGFSNQRARGRGRFRGRFGRWN